MRPIRLDMEGFGAFKQPTVVDFEDIELVALVGRTGSGKSTVIDALTFALYGSVARYDDNRAVAPVINQTSSRARVRLEFELGGRRYTAARLVQRQGTGATTKEARLECGEEVIAADARGVTAAVTALLGLDASQFNRTIVLPQGRFADFLHDDPGKRQETLRSLLGLGVYRDVASAARRRAGDRRVEADAVRSDTEAVAAALTDERRVAIVARGDALAAGRSVMADAMAQHESERATATEAGARLAMLTDELALLATVAAPRGLAELERASTLAAATLAATTAAVATARRRRGDADAAAAAGPDAAAVTADVAARHAANRAATEHAATAARLADAEWRAATTGDAAIAARATQHRLDDAAASASANERDRRAVLDGLASLVQLDHWLAQRANLTELTAAATRLASELDTAIGAIDPVRRAAAAAARAERERRDRRDDLRERAGAAGLAHLLAVGVPCPLCLREVDTIPVHHVDADLHAADAELAAATVALERATADLAAAEREVDERRARANAEQRPIDALRRELREVPPDAELAAQRTATAAAQQRVTAAAAAATAAEASARAHRVAIATVEVLDAAARAEADVAALRPLEAGQRDQLATAEWAALSLPPLDVLEASLAEARRLGATRDAAAAELAAAEADHERAMAAQRDGEQAQRNAIDELHRTRDRLATVQPPPVGGETLGASWHALVDWATVAISARTVQRDEAAAAAATATAAAERAATTVRAACAGLLGSTSDGALATLRDDVIAAIATNAAELATFDREREQLAVRLAKLERLDVERAVADHLGHLLRADGFEGWLMEAALGELVDTAGERLRELSSGQFSLELVGRGVMVRDHANADELRGARTLSGGETFLASLSLALALADATNDLAPEGAPKLESIFLDEGFGTLDPATLDVVASAIEELGAAGRMVAVVTHIRELAERMPVRLEITKVGATSTVERIDA